MGSVAEHSSSVWADVIDPGVWVASLGVAGAYIGATTTLVLSNRQRTREAAAAVAAAEKARAVAALERRAERQEDFDRSEAVREAAERVRVAVVDAAEKAAAVARQAEAAAKLLAARDERQEEEAEAARAKAAEAAQLLLEAQQESIRRTNEVARVAAESQATALGEIHEIKVLANSTLTAAMNGELGAMGRELVLMKDIRALHEAQGHPSSPERDAAIEATQAKIDEMRIAIADRVAQTEAAEQATRNAQAGEAAP